MLHVIQKVYQQVNYPQMLRESLWIFVDLCGSLWIFVDLCGYLWIFVDIASSLIYLLVGLRGCIVRSHDQFLYTIISFNMCIKLSYYYLKLDK